MPKTHSEIAFNLTRNELIKVDFIIAQNKESSRGLTIQSPSGKEYFIFIQPINLDKERSVKINKQELGEPKDNLWIGLVLLLEDMEPQLYLIPSKTLAVPDGYVFLDNPQNEMFSHLANWEIKVFKEGMDNLNEYRLSNQVKNLI